MSTIAVAPRAAFVTPYSATRTQVTRAPLTPKEYIASEIKRNKANTDLWVAMVRLAYGKDDPVMVGHHIGFELGNDFTTENEIPSADTLIFDHDIMEVVFGRDAIPIMMKLASLPVSERDSHLRALFLERHSL